MLLNHFHVQLELNSKIFQFLTELTQSILALASLKKSFYTFPGGGVQIICYVSLSKE